MVFPSPSRHPLFDADLSAPGCHWAARGYYLLRVELDDELFGQRDLDLSPLGQLVHEDALTLPHHLQPTGDLGLAGSLAGCFERQRVDRLLANVDDVVLRHPVAGDVDLDTVDGEVAVADQLASHATRAGEPGAVHDVVQAALQDAQQVLAGLTREAVGLFVVTTELLLHHAVGEAGLLL